MLCSISNIPTKVNKTDKKLVLILIYYFKHRYQKEHLYFIDDTKRAIACIAIAQESQNFLRFFLKLLFSQCQNAIFWKNEI